MLDVTVTLHNPSLQALDCMKSLAKQTKGVGKIVFVDNHTTGFMSPFYIMMASKMIYLDKQVSLAESWNIGIEQTISNYVLVSNDDIIFTPGWAEPLIAAMDADPKIGILQPYNTLGAIPENFPDNYKKEDRVGEIPADNFVGCCFVIRKDILPELKKFDNARFFGSQDDYTYFYPGFYPFGAEDQDFYRRVRETGFKTLTHFGSYVHHYSGETMKQIPEFEQIREKANNLYKERWNYGKI